VYFAPCCGIAWREPPLHGRLDEINSLQQVDPGPVTLPTREELSDAGVDRLVVRTEPLDDWVEDIPGFGLER
jgi:hypothetical protein